MSPGAPRLAEEGLVQWLILKYRMFPEDFQTQGTGGLIQWGGTWPFTQ
jgi:hypothetical protein